MSAERIIEVLIALIVLYAVLLPVIVDVIANLTGLSGTTLIVVSLAPLFVGLAGIVLITKGLITGK